MAERRCHGPIIVGVCAKDPGAALLKWEESGEKAAHLSERRVVFGPPTTPAVSWLRNGAWHGAGLEQMWQGNSGGGGPPPSVSLSSPLAESTTRKRH